jgi:hypothetical protein
MDFTYGADDNAPSFVESGTYPATIKRATEGKSKAGNPMLTLIWRLDNGLELFDHIVESPKPLCRKKSDQFLVAIGMEGKKGAKVSVDVAELDGQRADLVIVLLDGNNEVKGYAECSTEESDEKKPF